MFLVIGSYALLGFLVTALCAVWASWVAFDKYRNLEPDVRREVIIGLVVISLLIAPVAVIAAYWSRPLEQPSSLPRS